MRLLRLSFIFALALASVAGLANRQEPHNYDLQDVNWHIAFDANARTIHGEVTNTIVLTERQSSSVWFDCGPLTIEKVTVDGVRANSNLENDRLTVNLPKPARF